MGILGYGLWVGIFWGLGLTTVCLWLMDKGLVAFFNGVFKPEMLIREINLYTVLNLISF